MLSSREFSNKQESPQNRVLTFSFVGNIRRHSQYDLERDYILEKLVSQVNIQIFSKAALMDRGIVNDLKAWAKDGTYSTVESVESLKSSRSSLESYPDY